MADKGLISVLSNRVSSLGHCYKKARQDEAAYLLGVDMPHRVEFEAQIRETIEALTNEPDQLSAVQEALAEVDALTDEARAARDWIAELERRYALANSYDHLVEVQSELAAYVRFREDQQPFIEDGQQLMRRVAGETRKKKKVVQRILQQILDSSYEEQRKELWQSLQHDFWADLRDPHQELMAWRTELHKRFSRAGLQRWADPFWYVMFDGFPDMRVLDMDLSEDMLDQYRRLIGWGIVWPVKALEE